MIIKKNVKKAQILVLLYLTPINFFRLEKNKFEKIEKWQEMGWQYENCSFINWKITAIWNAHFPSHTILFFIFLSTPPQHHDIVTLRTHTIKCREGIFSHVNNEKMQHTEGIFFHWKYPLLDCRFSHRQSLLIHIEKFSLHTDRKLNSWKNSTRP